MLKIKVYGIVQSVGFRPFVARLAARLRICGTVKNCGTYVEIIADGANLSEFVAGLKSEAPSRAVVDRIEIDEAADFDIGQNAFDSFTISESTIGDEPNTAVLVPPDIAVCEHRTDKSYKDDVHHQVDAQGYIFLDREQSREKIENIDISQAA